MGVSPLRLCSWAFFSCTAVLLWKLSSRWWEFSTIDGFRSRAGERERWVLGLKMGWDGVKEGQGSYLRQCMISSLFFPFVFDFGAVWCFVM